jgi:hypothetical protein
MIRGGAAAACVLLVLQSFAAAQEMPAEYRRVLDALGRSGDFKDGVLKVNIPRSDLRVSVAGVATPTPFGFGGWVAMAPGDGVHVMMGDLVLTEDEVNPVMSALLERGLHATALHNHFFHDSPRVFYMHVHGHGTPPALAERLMPALSLIGRKPPPAAGGGTPIEGALSAPRLADIVGHAGEQAGAVYKITIGRPDLDVREMGAVINARMGLNTWAAFYGRDDDAVVAGDFAMTEEEVTPVLQALRGAGLDVVAIHHHMTNTRPVVIFLHYWGRGPAAQLARAVRAGLDAQR